MFVPDVFGVRKVCHRACHLQDAVVGTGGEVQFPDKATHAVLSGPVQPTEVGQVACTHVGIAVDARKAREPRGLSFPCRDDPCADGGGGFPAWGVQKFGEGDGRKGELDVDAVEEGTRNLAAIGRDLALGAAADVRGVVRIAARGTDSWPRRA